VQKSLDDRADSRVRHRDRGVGHARLVVLGEWPEAANGRRPVDPDRWSAQGRGQMHRSGVVDDHQADAREHAD
jgi:hypothetical protein